MATAPTPSASSIEDCALVKRALDGDQSAYQALMRKYSRALRYHIARTVNRPREVDDLVQESFIKAFKSLESYSTRYAFSTWLYRIATNHAIDFLRKKRLDTVSMERPAGATDGPRQRELPSTDNRPDRHIVNDQRRDLIQAAINRLPPKYHRVIVLRHQKEMTYQEIAEKLDLPLGTVKAHIFRARRQLYTFLRDQRDNF